VFSWSTTLQDPTNLRLYREFAESYNTVLNAFLEFDPERAPGEDAGDGAGHDALTGLPFGVKDNLAVSGFRLTCGSRMLADMVSPYTATAVRRLQEAGARVVGKTNLDEFGMGSSTENSAFGPTRNPFDTSLVAGGSSGGSAAAVAAGMVPFALGSDTGGSIRQPAAFCGVYGLKPTYGAVSRYGLVAYASSLEVVGVMAADPRIMEQAFWTMQGVDERDQTSVRYPEGSEGKSPQAKSPQGTSAAATIGILSGDLSLDPRVQRSYETTRERLEELGYRVVEVEIPMLEYVVPVYYTIATAEASANLARFNGVRYGYRPDYAENPEELVRKARSEAFGDEVKLRVLLGTYVLRSGFQDEYYVRAQRIRTGIRNELTQAFDDIDLLLTPTYPVPAFPIGGRSSFEQKTADLFTSAANLAGIPAATFPVTEENGVPVGMQLMARPFDEAGLFGALREYHDSFGAPRPSEYPGLEEWLESTGRSGEWKSDSANGAQKGGA
jgi:aspartyl-tRNA(Asn)/glutamyl-tRNA(Gln) amidotransferase subunit A